MKFEIPFNKEIYLNQIKLIIPLTYSDYYKKVKESLIVGLISIGLGIFIIMGKSSLGYLFITLGIVSSINSYIKFKEYRNLKKIHLTIIEEKLSETSISLENGIIEFNEVYLTYIDKTQSRQLNWAEFDGYKIIKSNLLLVLDQKKGDIMVIGEDEIGSENFKKIIEFVKTKLK